MTSVLSLFQNPAGQEQSLRHRRHCRGTTSARQAAHQARGLATGYRALDERLLQGGLPRGGLVEVLSDGNGIGALGPFLQAMATLSVTEERWQTLIAPPSPPYAPLLSARGIDTGKILVLRPTSPKQLLLSCERALRSGTSAAVLCWLGATRYTATQMQQLQSAAANSDSLAILFRASQTATQASPASLRLMMSEYRRLHILKQCGGEQALDVELAASDELPCQPQLWELPNSPHSSSSWARF